MKTRITGGSDSCYHVFSRIIERRFYLQEREKDIFRDIMWRVAEFSGVNILTYCIMDNHFHILVQIPERKNVNDEILLQRLITLYGRSKERKWRDPVREFEQSANNPVWRARLRKKYLRRMYDLSEFMRTLKLRYSFWYNRNHNREGTLWDMRFKSVLVQTPRYRKEQDIGRLSLVTVAAYIDLNCVRAGIVNDPVDYRWCGYGDACRGVGSAQYGLGVIYSYSAEECPKWNSVHSSYRSVLFKNDGDNCLLKPNVLLGHRVRYFTGGAVLGSKSFVDDAFAKHRFLFSEKRTTGARPMRGGDWGGLCAARQVG